MKSEKCNRSVGLICPTCGSDQFAYSDDPIQDHAIITCADCGRQFTRDQLIQENSENLQGHIASMGEDIMKDAAKEMKESFRKAFKGNKHVRFK